MGHFGSGYGYEFRNSVILVSDMKFWLSCCFGYGY